jgi:hypothetical protein
MTTVTLGTLVKMVRAEAGHALTPSQGLNTVDTLKHLIKRTEEELWTAFQWPTLTVRWDTSVQVGQTEYMYPAELQFDQIREVLWTPDDGQRWSVVEFGIPEEAHQVYGTTAAHGTTIKYWETQTEEFLRIWPVPTQKGFIRLKGMKPLNSMCSDDDCCTLDATIITLFVAAELLTRAKADDAKDKLQKAQRHLQKTLANKVSAKHKVSTFGAFNGPRPNTNAYFPSWRNMP